MRKTFFLLFLLVPAAAAAQEFHPYYPNGNSSPVNDGPGSTNNDGNTNNNNPTNNFPSSIDYSGPVTISLPISSGRSQARVVSALARNERDGMRAHCRSISPNGDGRVTYVVNGRNRRYKLEAVTDSIEISISRVSDNEYSGTENVTFRCIIDR